MWVKSLENKAPFRKQNAKGLPSPRWPRWGIASLGGCPDPPMKSWARPSPVGRPPDGSKKPGFGVKKSRKKKNMFVNSAFFRKWYCIQASFVTRKPRMHIVYSSAKGFLPERQTTLAYSCWLGHSNDNVTMTSGLTSFFGTHFPKIQRTNENAELQKPKELWPPLAWQM